MGTLSVVATPIGNLEDITLRALRVLREADLVLAEDTRRTRILLRRHGIPARPRSLHAHNEASRSREALEALREQRRVALVSDAGTPLVSDPGGRLVAAVLDEGHRVEAVPGASAVLTALTVCGLRAVPFTFLGFLPRRAGARRALLERWRAGGAALVLFESPRRLGTTLGELAQTFGERRACVARELTKLHEEVVRGSLAQLAERFCEGTRGEVTIVVEGAAERGAPESGGEDATLEACIRALLAEGRSPKEVAATLAPALRRPKRDLYARAVAARESR
jgi:16S rRNA (cytidine1402-2'-O)-methyltransferase